MDKFTTNCDIMISRWKNQTYVFCCLIILTVLTWINPVCGGEHDSAAYWIFLKDKAFTDEIGKAEALKAYERSLPDRAVRRRSRTNRPYLVDETDLPVNREYLDIIRQTDGVSIRHTSRWLNAVSADLSRSAVRSLAQLPFVLNLKKVRSFVRSDELIQFEEVEPDNDIPHRDHELEYGLSLRQNAFLNTPELHDRGLFGTGVLIGVLDAGFNNLDHDCFESLDLLDAWDFVNDDDNVGDEDDRGSGSHGTKTLSIIAGYDPGRMIGTAFDATFILAKTEDTDWENRVEEDHWVAGIEWMDEYGVEVVSSSLSYFDWYDYEEMDGETGVTTIAADQAVEVGIVVVNAMGNTGRGRYPSSKMGAPADAFNALSIGATNQDSMYANWASQGPTWDRRIKPDFTTIGTSVRFASANVDSQYGGGVGTSFSTPAVAGLCALLIQANPYLNPETLRDLLRSVANHSEDPDTLYGWGIPDGLAALNEGGFIQSGLVIPLHRGWNTISHNLDMVALDLNIIMRPLLERQLLVLVKDSQGRFFYPLRNFNDIPFWSQLEGYQVQVTEDYELTLEGNLIPYNTVIEVEQGWQMVSYLPDFPMDPPSALESLVSDDNLIIAKDDHGRFYLPEFGFHNIPFCRPGKGYHIKTNRPGSLIYARHRLLDSNEERWLNPVFFPVPELPGENMSFLFLSDKDVRDGDEIGCFDEFGDLVGSGVFQSGKCGIAVGKKNLSENARLTFKLYSKLSGSIFDPVLETIRGNRLYQTNSFSVQKIGIPQNRVPDEYQFEFEINPNPFNAAFQIRIIASNKDNLRLAIFDMEGRMKETRNLSEVAGDDVTIYAEGWATGSYLIRLENGRFQSEKLVHLIK